jgi:hypothetical protein
MDVEQLTEDLFKYKKKSLYKIARTAGEERLNTPFPYTEGNEVVKRTISPYILRNPVVEKFLQFINDHTVLMFKATTWIKLKRVYTVDKDYEYIK